MALPDSPLTRGEQYLSAIAGEETALPNVPLTRIEQYLAKIAGQDVAIPNVPLTRMEQYLDYIAENGGGGGSDVIYTSVTLTEDMGMASFFENVVVPAISPKTSFFAVNRAEQPETGGFFFQGLQFRRVTNNPYLLQKAIISDGSRVRESIFTNNTVVKAGSNLGIWGMDFE